MLKTIFAAALVVPAQALGTPCGQDLSKIDRAICGNASLAEADRRLNDTYVKAMGLLDKVGHDRLRLDQRDWMAERDRSCTALEADALVECLRRQTWARTNDVDQRLWLGREGQSLTFGGETLRVKRYESPDGDIHLMHGGDAIATTSSGSRGFVITGRYTSDAVDAVALDVTNVGNLGCADELVIEARKGHPLRSRSVEQDCDTPVTKTPEGFEYVTPAGPTEDGRVFAWRADGFFGVERTLPFQPVPGTTLADVNPSDHEPMRNAALYERVRQQTGDAWKDVAGLMRWGDTNDVGPGVEIPTGFKAVFGCDISRAGGCLKATRGIIAIEDATGRTFIALKVGDGPDRLWPDDATWPTPLRSVLEAWRSRQ